MDQNIIELANSKANVFVVEDHLLLRNAISHLLSSFDGYTVCGQAGNGSEFIRKVGHGPVPDVVLMDIQMPLMDGVETARWLKANHPKVKVIALSMFRDEHNIIRMIRAGVSGYLPKDSSPGELKAALDKVRHGQFYYSDLVSSAMMKNMICDPEDPQNEYKLSARHLEFLKLASTEMTYKEVAYHMHLSVRTIDSYRDELFAKLKVRSRIGLVRFAIKNRIVELE
ncbi:MAG: response regulator transcription factor [Cyclobacteriaceae bacterium]